MINLLFRKAVIHMNILNKSISNYKKRPIKVLQFGEGNFLRGFVDYMIDIANERGMFNGNIVLAKPIAYGNLEYFHRQECQYTVHLSGIEDGRPKESSRIVSSLSDALGVYENYEEYMSYAKLDSLRFIVSNTTEAGIVYDDRDRYDAMPPESYPGKLTKFLYQRYKYFNGDKDKGLIILPCELIENNGKTLKEYVEKLSRKWDLDNEFITWIDEACIFCNTLVDRIITGYPKKEEEKHWDEYGYQDNLLVTGELFALWVIESEKDISKEFPLDKAGLPLLFTKDITPYRDRKVRILNGAHTSLVAASYLAGNDTVKESLDDSLLREYIMGIIYDEVIPTLNLTKHELEDFAAKVIERFENPFIKHSLLSISLNSVSKWKARCLPSFKDYYRIKNKIPSHLSFSLAALIAFYRGERDGKEGLISYRDGKEYMIMDDENVLEFFDGSARKDNHILVKEFLMKSDFFGEDMTKYSGLTDTVITYLDNIDRLGMRGAIKDLLDQ